MVKLLNPKRRDRGRYTHFLDHKRPTQTPKVNKLSVYVLEAPFTQNVKRSFSSIDTGFAYKWEHIHAVMLMLWYGQGKYPITEYLIKMWNLLIS